MKRLLFSILSVYLFFMGAGDLLASEGDEDFTAISSSLLASPMEGKDLYELIGLDKTRYEQEKSKAIGDVDTLSYDQIQKELRTISQTKDLAEKLSVAKRAMDKAKRMYDVSISPRVTLEASHEERVEAREQEIQKDFRQKESFYNYYLSQAKNRIKQKRYEGTDFQNWAKPAISQKCSETRKKLRKDIDKLEEELKLYPPSPEQRSKKNREINEIKEKLQQVAKGCEILLDPKLRAQYDAALAKVGAIAPERAYEEMKDAVEAGMRLMGTGMRVSLNALIGSLLSQIDIPGPAVKLFNQDLALSNVHVLPKPKGEDIKYYIGFTGTAEFNQAALKADFYAIWDTYNKLRWSFSIATPDAYRLPDLFPSLSSLNWMLFPKAKFVLATFNGTDQEGYSFKKGLNFIGEWDIFSGPLAFFKRLQSAAPKLEGLVFESKPIILSGLIPKNPLLSEFSATVPLYIGVDFTKISILPKAFTNVINKITLGGLTVEISPYERSLADQAESVTQKIKTLKAKMDAAQRAYDQEKGGLSIAGRAPAQQQRLVALRKQELESAKRQYQAEAKLQAEAQEEEEVAGIQSFFETIEQEPKAPEEKQKRIASYLQDAPGRAKIQRAAGYLADKSPIQRAAVKQEAPERVSTALQTAKNFGYSVKASAEGILQLGTQPDPIKLVVSGLVIPPGFKYKQGFISLSAELKNMIEFGWLAIGNAAIVIDIDIAALNVLMALNIPVSGVFINGQIDLGRPGESRASLKIGGGVSLGSQQGVENVIFDITGENIRPTDFVRYLGYQLMRSKYARKGAQGLTEKGSQLLAKVLPKGVEIPGISLPELVFHKVSGYAALGSATIGTQTYKSGLGLEMEIELFNKKAGFRIFIGDEQKGYSLEGYGYGPPLSLSIRGKNVFRMYSAEDASKGPYISWEFNPQQLFKITPTSKAEAITAGLKAAREDVIEGGTMRLNAVVELPVFGFKQAASFNWNRYVIDADFETTLGGFAVLFGIKMDTKGDPIDESEFQKGVREVRAILASRPMDAEKVAAMHLLQLISDKPNRLNRKVLDEAEKLAGPPSPMQETVRQRASRLVGGLTEQFKKRPEIKIDPEVEKEAMSLVNSAILSAQFERLKQEASEKGITPDPARNQEVQEALRGKDLGNIQRALQAYRSALKLEDVKSPPPKANWKDLLVSFGFKNTAELSKRISQQFIPYLNRKKESYLQKVAAIDAKAKRWEEGTIDPSKELAAIAARESKIAQLKEFCSKRAYTNQIACQSKIKLEQARLLRDKAILKAFIESKASRNVKRVAAIGYRKAQIGRAMKAVVEKTLNALTSTLDAIAKGADILSITEVKGEYGYRDMVGLRLPRLVTLKGEVSIMEISVPFNLSDLQFDFKNPIASTGKIATAIGNVFTQTLEREYLSNIPEEARGLLGEMAGL